MSHLCQYTRNDEQYMSHFVKHVHDLMILTSVVLSQYTCVATERQLCVNI